MSDKHFAAVVVVIVFTLPDYIPSLLQAEVSGITSSVIRKCAKVQHKCTEPQPAVITRLVLLV